MVPNLYKDLPTFADEEKGYINVVIDIPKGSFNKYEYDEEGGYFALDRTLHHSMFYPFDYGFIPQTHAGDGDAVDVAVLVTHPTFSGCVIKCRVLGYIDTEDESGQDAKVIAVPIEKLDPRFKEIQEIEDIPEHTLEEIRLFFKEYKHLEKGKYEHIKIRATHSRKDAMNVIQDARKSYHSKEK